MDFEEFFKKKRIDLTALEKAEPALFSEFKTHYDQMGEKSFDHTKKYWFNNLRRQFHLAPEVKTEKPHTENTLAEQTITESLAENTPPATVRKLGFVPKFKAGNIPKTATEGDEKPSVPIPPHAVDEKSEQQPGDSTEVKPGAYKPRFNMKNIKPKPPEEQV